MGKKKREGSQRWRGKPQEEKEAGAGGQSLSLWCSSRRFCLRQSCRARSLVPRTGRACHGAQYLVWSSERSGGFRAQKWDICQRHAPQQNWVRCIFMASGVTQFCLRLLRCRLPLKNILRDGCSGKLSKNLLIGTKPQTMSSVASCD